MAPQDTSQDSISRIIYINPEKSSERRKALEITLADAGVIQAKRSPVFADFNEFDDRRQTDILSRMKMLDYYNGKKWGFAGPETNYNDVVLPPQDEADIPDAIKQHAYGKYACHLSHIKTMEHLLATLQPEDESKWLK